MKRGNTAPATARADLAMCPGTRRHSGGGARGEIASACWARGDTTTDGALTIRPRTDGPHGRDAFCEEQASGRGGRGQNEPALFHHTRLRFGGGGHRLVNRRHHRVGRVFEISNRGFHVRNHATPIAGSELVNRGADVVHRVQERVDLRFRVIEACPHLLELFLALRQLRFEPGHPALEFPHPPAVARHLNARQREQQDEGDSRV